MTTFTVKWENKIDDQNSPLEAAKNCLSDIVNLDCLCFTVINEDTNEQFSVDLSEDDEFAVLKINLNKTI